MANRINVDLLSTDHINQLIVHAMNNKELYEILRDKEQDRLERIRASIKNERPFGSALPWDLDAMRNAKENIAYNERNRVAYHTLIGALEALSSVQ